MALNFKMEDLRRNSRLVSVRHGTKPTSDITYASVVFRETVRISLKLAALKYFPVKVADIQNAYIVEPVTEKIWIVLVREFCEDVGRRAIVVRAIYGMNSYRAEFLNNLADCMHPF